MKTADSSLSYKTVLVHCENVSKLVSKILPYNDNLVMSSLLHDIGKIDIPLFVLNKSGPLTQEEFNLILKHPQLGAKIVKGMGYCDEITIAILHHHERWDGNGYPHGLKGSKIPLYSRIIAIVDAFDAMLTDRPYRCALSKDKAINELITNAGAQFDPSIVEDFLRAIKKKNNLWDGYFWGNI